MPAKLHLPHDRYFDPDPQQKEIALQLYAQVADLPLICPHGHVDPTMFADPDYQFGTPTELLLIPDHYVFRMLYSQGIPMEQLAIPRLDGTSSPVSHEEAWQTFADHFYLFRGTPTGMWLTQELHQVFGIDEKLTGASAPAIYQAIKSKLAQPEFHPRHLFTQFNIEVLATTDPATSDLAHHKAMRASGLDGNIIPTFRPDAVVNLDASGWRQSIDELSQVSGIDVTGYAPFIQALEKQRAFFKEMGATASDHAALTPFTERLSDQDAEIIFRRALAGDVAEADVKRFTGHMLMEMARMSTEDGLVMQLHPGSYRGHNQHVLNHFGPDMGADIPIATEFTRNLHPLLNAYGNHPNFTFIVFMLDEATLSPRTCTVGGPLSGHASGAAVVVLRLVERHDALPRTSQRDRWAVQHRWLQRRHARLPLHPRPSRSGPSRRR